MCLPDSSRDAKSDTLEVIMVSTERLKNLAFLPSKLRNARNAQ